MGRKNIGSPEDLDFDFGASGSQTFELACQFSNCEIHIAITLRWPRAVRALRQDSMTEGPDGETRAPECDSDTGTEHRAQYRGAARQMNFAELQVDLR